jgi:hypothetical protein
MSLVEKSKRQDPNMFVYKIAHQSKTMTANIR